MLILVIAASGILAASAGANRPSPTVIFRTEATSISGQSATPSSISFTASNPDTAPTVSASATAVVRWNMSGGSTARTWTLRVSAPATFTSCATVPSSAVTVTCSSVTGSGSCGGSTALSTTATTVASGTEPNGSSTVTVNLALTLADKWTYIASSLCSLSLTYNITAN